MNPWLTCPGCGALLTLVGGFGLIRLNAGGLACIGLLRDHDCAEIEKNYVMAVDAHEKMEGQNDPATADTVRGPAGTYKEVRRAEV